jgi:hypothetical protein
MCEVSTIAAYRDRWHIASQSALGKQGDAASMEQAGQRQRAQAAAVRAMAISSAAAQKQTSTSPELAVEVQTGVEL